MNAEDAQKKYMEYNMYKQQIEALAQELSVLNTTTNTLSSAKLTLKNVSDLAEKPEILVPIGGNAFLKAKIEDTKNILVGIGSDVIVKKNTDDAVEMLDTQLQQLEDARTKLEQQMQDLSGRIQKIEPELQAAMQQLQGAAPKA